MFKKLTAQLEALFDQDQNQNWLIEQGLFDLQKTFKTEDSLSGLQHLSYVHETISTPAELTTLTTQLGCHFEYVFCMKRIEKHAYVPYASMIFGKILPHNMKWNSIQLPSFTNEKVYRTSSHGLFKKFCISTLDPQFKTQVYLIQVSHDYVFIVASHLAEPWAELKISTLQNTLFKIHFNL